MTAIDALSCVTMNVTEWEHLLDKLSPGVTIYDEIDTFTDLNLSGQNLVQLSLWKDI